MAVFFSKLAPDGWREQWVSWRWALLLGVFCALLQWAGMNTVIRFDRYLIDDGHWWLLYSGNLVHFDWHHFVRNLAGLLLIQGLFGHLLKGWQWFVVLSIAFWGVGIGIYFFTPQVIWYVGLSGAEFGAFIVGAFLELRHAWRYALAMFVLVYGRLIYEVTVGPMPGAEEGGLKVVIDAHLYGTITGTLLGVGILAWQLSRLPAGQRWPWQQADRQR